MVKRLDLQIFLILSLILATMIAAFGWRIGSRQTAMHLQSMSEYARLISLSHANNAAHYIVIMEFAGLEDHMLEAARLPNVTSLQVFEPDGKVVCDISRDAADGAPKANYQLGRSAVPAGAAQVLQLTTTELVCWTPVTAGKMLGWLKITFSLGSVLEMRDSVWRNTLLMGFLWVVTGTGLMVLFLRRPLRAIRELGLFARDLNRNKGAQLRLPRVALEIDQLAESLNCASSELQTAEQQLIDEQERLAVTIRSIGDGVIACDRSGHVVLMNRVAEELTGWSMAEARDLPFAEVFTVIDEQTGDRLNIPLQNVIETGRIIELVEQAVLLSRSGTRCNIADSGAPIVNAQGDIVGIVIVFRDESARLLAEKERLGLEEQLRQSQKMEAIGHLAGGIAHDFNNILMAILGYSSMLAEQLPQGSPEQILVEKVLQAGNRATTLTRGLLAFSRKQKMELKLCDLNEIVRDQEYMLRRIIGEDIQLKTKLADLPLVVKADIGQIEQVIMNLATNARDAMAGGGLLSIALQSVDVDNTSGEYGDQVVANGTYALVCVSDSGAGMEAALVDKIFEPFFTTKTVGKGTGLGLSIVHGIIQQHNGIVRVYSNVGIGTTFKIYLPLHKGEGVVPETEIVQEVKGGRERILLVEDESEVRQVLRHMLSGGGYEVVEAEDGVAALELLRKWRRDIHLVVSDVIMPRMTGKVLQEKIQEEFPGTQVLFISGYTADVIQFKGILEHDIDLLMKPFTARVLLRRVREILDRNGAAGAVDQRPV